MDALDTRYAYDEDILPKGHEHGDQKGCGCGCNSGCDCDKEFCVEHKCNYSKKVCYECKYVCRRKIYEPPMKVTNCNPFCRPKPCCCECECPCQCQCCCK